VAAIVTALVTTTARSVQGAHHGHDNLLASSVFDMEARIA
jgi:hypothetical protein